MTTKDSIPVLFRVSRGDPDDVFALFPTLPGTYEPHTCTCYQHIGQHSSADLHGCIASSRPAKPEEYADLLKELTGIYSDCALRVMRRNVRSYNEQRRASLKWRCTDSDVCPDCHGFGHSEDDTSKACLLCNGTGKPPTHKEA